MPCNVDSASAAAATVPKMTAFKLPDSNSTRTEYVYPFLAKPLPESREAKDVVSGLKEALQGSSAEVSSREDDRCGDVHTPSISND